MMQKCRLNIFKISKQSVTQAVPVNANVNCYCIIWIVQEFLARIKHWVEFVISQSRKIFLTWEKLRVEDCLKLELRLLDSRRNRVLRVESKLLEAKPFIIDYKQRPFQFDESCSKWELRIETQQSRINFHENRESSVNLLLNSTIF